MRCAVYTRKSSEEGLEQAFNSLDAQREACAAFIVSQKHEGWTVLPTLYDDGGFSGGTMDRPALQHLLGDIGTDKADVVVVYKIDRLTRSQFDFAKIVDAFDARGVSFVSVTQQFNTTTSMGRLTLNVLLSFAQFEREVVGERVRDKFQRYVQLRSVRALRAELDAAGIRSKRRTLADGTPYGGHKLSRGALYLMLKNRIYRGEITHKGDAYPGEHPAIVDKPLWDQVQVIRGENRVSRATGSDAKHPRLLVGLVFDENGERLTPSHAVKKGTRYRYYVSTSLITGADKDRSKGRRIPAANLETLVMTRLRTLLADRGAILDAIQNEYPGAVEQNRLIRRGRQIAEELGTLAPDQARAILTTLLSSVDIRPDRVEINISRCYLIELLEAQSINPTTQGRKSDKKSEDVLTLTVRARLQRVGREMRMLVDNSDDQPTPDPGLLRIVARAHEIQERLVQNTDLTVHVIASQEHVSANYVYRLLRLATLAPDIITAIVNGKNPPQPQEADATDTSNTGRLG
jgi:DNA invertase Pin-like site-specific DNA recombinase